MPFELVVAEFPSISNFTEQCSHLEIDPTRKAPACNVPWTALDCAYRLRNASKGAHRESRHAFPARSVALAPRACRVAHRPGGRRSVLPESRTGKKPVLPQRRRAIPCGRKSRASRTTRTSAWPPPRAVVKGRSVSATAWGLRRRRPARSPHRLTPEGGTPRLSGPPQ
jgi:hypothetical protein